MIRIFLLVSTGPKKITRGGENTVGTYRALRNMDKAIEPRSVSFQFPGAPSSMGSSPSLSSSSPPTTLHLRRHSNLFSAAGWHALRPNSLSQDALLSIPYIFPFHYSVSLLLCTFFSGLFTIFDLLSSYLHLFSFGLIYRHLSSIIYSPYEIFTLSV